MFETISQSLLNAVDRDALSGWGAHVYIIEKDKVTKLVGELRELAVKGQSGGAALSVEQIREKIHEMQQASLCLFKKV